MTKNGQKFIFILEQSKDSYDYDSRKYLNTCMNRIAVEEDDQNEISSIHEFKHASFDLFKSNKFHDENYEILRAERDEKHVHDKRVIAKAKFSYSGTDPYIELFIEICIIFTERKRVKALAMAKSDNSPVHIFIGGDYYAYSMNPDLDLSEDMEPFLLKTLTYLQIRKASVNILRLSRQHLITKDGFQAERFSLNRIEKPSQLCP